MTTDTPIKCPDDARKRMDDNPGATHFVLKRGEMEALLSCFPHSQPPARIDVDALASALFARMKGESHG
jgi:hypothetical protein